MQTICFSLQTDSHIDTSSHTHPFNGPFSGTTQVSRYQKGKTNQDFTEARDSEWQWHQLGYMQVCTLLQTDNHASTPPLIAFTGWMPFLLPNQHRQSTEGTTNTSSRIEVLSVFTPGAVVTVQADWRVLCDQGTEER